eukprot:4772236-Prymnesium_polylepis.2
MTGVAAPSACLVAGPWVSGRAGRPHGCQVVGSESVHPYCASDASLYEASRATQPALRLAPRFAASAAASAASARCVQWGSGL